MNTKFKALLAIPAVALSVSAFAQGVNTTATADGLSESPVEARTGGEVKNSDISEGVGLVLQQGDSSIILPKGNPGYSADTIAKAMEDAKKFDEFRQSEKLLQSRIRILELEVEMAQAKAKLSEANGELITKEDVDALIKEREDALRKSHREEIESLKKGFDEAQEEKDTTGIKSLLKSQDIQNSDIEQVALIKIQSLGGPAEAHLFYKNRIFVANAGDMVAPGIRLAGISSDSVLIESAAGQKQIWPSTHDEAYYKSIISFIPEEDDDSEDSDEPQQSQNTGSGSVIPLFGFPNN